MSVIATEKIVQVVEAGDEAVVTIVEKQTQIIEARDALVIYSNDGGGVRSLPFSNITEFTATHNLGRLVGAQVLDENGKEIGVVITRTFNTVTIYSDILISGTLIII